MYLLDTNICIFAMKKKSEVLLSNLKQFHSISYLSSLTIAELEFGISKSSYPEKNRFTLLKFISIFEILSFDEHDAIAYGKIKSDLKRRGCMIGPIDLLIAGQSVCKNLTLVTNNTKEFERIENLALEDWTQG